MAKDAITLLNALSSGREVNENEGVQRMMIVAPSDEGSCPAPKPTVNNNINPSNLVSGGSDVWTNTITNGSPDPVTLFLGLGILNQTGIPANFGVTDAAVDEPLCVDEFGAAFAKGEVFSRFAGRHSAIITSLKIFNASAAQVSTPIAIVTADPNGDFRETRAKNVEQNTDLNYVKLTNCNTALTDWQGISYVLGAGESIDMEVEMLGWDIVGNFSNSLVSK